MLGKKRLCISKFFGGILKILEVDALGVPVEGAVWRELSYLSSGEVIDESGVETVFDESGEVVQSVEMKRNVYLTAEYLQRDVDLLNFLKEESRGKFYRVYRHLGTSGEGMALEAFFGICAFIPGFKLKNKQNGFKIAVYDNKTDIEFDAEGISLYNRTFTIGEGEKYLLAESRTLTPDDFTITGLTVGSIDLSDLTASAVWHTRVDTTSFIHYGLNEPDINVSDGLLKDFHLLRLENLIPGASYSLQAKSANVYGVERSSEIITFNVPDRFSKIYNIDLYFELTAEKLLTYQELISLYFGGEAELSDESGVDTINLLSASSEVVDLKSGTVINNNIGTIVEIEVT